MSNFYIERLQSALGWLATPTPLNEAPWGALALLNPRRNEAVADTMESAGFGLDSHLPTNTAELARLDELGVNPVVRSANKAFADALTSGALTQEFIELLKERLQKATARAKADGLIIDRAELEAITALNALRVQGTPGGSGKARKNHNQGVALASSGKRLERAEARRARKAHNRCYDRQRLRGDGHLTIAPMAYEPKGRSLSPSVQKALDAFSAEKALAATKAASDKAIAERQQLCMKAAQGDQEALLALGNLTKGDRKRIKRAKLALKPETKPEPKTKTKTKPKAKPKAKPKMSAERRAQLKAQFRNRAVQGREGFVALAETINSLNITINSLNTTAKAMLAFAGENIGCTVEEAIDEIRLLDSISLRALERDWANTPLAEMVDTETVNANYNAILARYGQSATEVKA